MMDDQIRELDDTSALRMLGLIAEAHQDQEQEATPSRELAGAMNEALGRQCEGTEKLSDGEAARMALMLLAKDQRFAGPIEAMLKGPSPERLGLGVVESTLLATGILLALQIHFNFKRNKDGSWTFEIGKRPTSNALLTPLVKKLLSIAGR